MPAIYFQKAARYVLPPKKGKKKKPKPHVEGSSLHGLADGIVAADEEKLTDNRRPPYRYGRKVDINGDG